MTVRSQVTASASIVARLTRLTGHLVLTDSPCLTAPTPVAALAEAATYAPTLMLFNDKYYGEGPSPVILQMVSGEGRGGGKIKSSSRMQQRIGGLYDPM